MIIIQRKKLTYYIKEESIIVEYNAQYISYNVYSLQNRKRFKDFKKSILESHYDEYEDIHELMSLAMKFGLKGMVGRKPLIDELDTFQK
jgi:hypothetical protein